MDIDEVTLLYRVRRTVLQMLKDRGYIIKEDKLQQSKQDFATYYHDRGNKRDCLNMMVERRKDQQLAASEFALEEENQKMVVFFPDVEKLNMADLKQIALKMIETNCFNSIVIVKSASQVSQKVSSCHHQWYFSTDSLPLCEVKVCWLISLYQEM